MPLMTAEEAREQARAARQVRETNARDLAWQHLAREIETSIHNGASRLELRLEKARWPPDILDECVQRLIARDYGVTVADYVLDDDLYVVTIVWET